MAADQIPPAGSADDALDDPGVDSTPQGADATDATDAGTGEAPDSGAEASADDNLDSLLTELNASRQAENAEKVEPEPEKAPEAAEPEKAKPEAEKDDPTADTLAKYPKKPREHIERLLEQRKAQREEIATLAPKAQFAEQIVADATDAGLITQTERGLDLKAFASWIDVGRAVNQDPPEKAAQRLRAMADAIHALPPVSTPPTVALEEVKFLLDKLSEGEMTHATASAMLEKLYKSASVKPPEAKPAAEKALEKPPERKPEGPTPEQRRHEAGLKMVSQKLAELSAAHKLDWPKIRDQVAQAVDADIEALSVPPEKWAALMERKAKEILAKQVQKRPPVEARPSHTGRRAAPVTTLEDDVAAALGID